MEHAQEAGSEESLQFQAYETIREGILYARYAPGDRLQVKDLCSDLNMGRTPVRESLVRLRQEGLVQTIPQSGTYVNRISLRSVECARYVRENLERRIAIECCVRIDAEGEKALSNIMRRAQDAYESRETRLFFDTDNLFHQAIYRIAERERIWGWLESINMDLQRYRWLRVLTEELDWDAIMHQHGAIFDAITHRDVDETGFLVSNHLHLLFEESGTVTKRFSDYFLFDLPKE
ncbi:MAG: GntR family transcriptional regulator [Coriobacteriaceae bacterium]|nr:GntR family transcriptional regulator [Coriobacteriaceae bacterium]MCI7438934.1 GntR family transcriptional regulator [Coriobacteriaceae bacterium]